LLADLVDNRDLLGAGILHQIVCSSSGGSGDPFSATGAPDVYGRMRTLRGDGVVPQTVGIDLDAGTHRGGQRDALQVAALGRGRLGPLELVEHGPEVGEEGVVGEAHLADRDVHVAVAVGAVLHFA